jgi:putative hydrolase of the HAD superfamily
MIFFDAAGTLVRLPKGVGWHYRAVTARYGWDVPEAELTRAFRAAWQKASPAPTTRSQRMDDDKGWWQALVWQVLDGCGAPQEFDRAAFFEELYAEFTLPGVWTLFPEAREVIEQLRRRFRLGVISNFDGRLRRVFDHLELSDCFELMVISSEVGADKPDPWIFQRALELAGIEAHEALHVGDDPDCDWTAAESAGLRSFRLDRPHNSLLDLLAVLE